MSYTMKLGVLAAALVLAGCAGVGPTYQQPALELPTKLVVPKLQAGKTSEQAHWWKQLHDPVLSALLDEAALHNQDLLLASARIAEARASSIGAQANRYPSVDAAASSSRNRSSTNAGKLPQGANPISNDFQISLSASYEVDLWGKLANADTAARARLLAQEANRAIVQTSLVANVVQNYLSLRSFDAQLALAENTLKTRQEYARLVDKRLAAGSSNQLEANQVKAELAANQISVAQLRQSVSNTESALAVLLGRSPKQIAQPEIARGLEIAALYQQLTMPLDLPSDLLQRRPDIVAAEQALIAANADVGQAKAQYFPSLRFTTSLGRESRVLEDLFSPASMLWNLAAGLTQPVFRAGAIGALVDGAQARKDQALAQYVQTVQASFRDVHDVLSNLRANDEVAASSQARLLALQETRRLVQLRYKSGYSSYQDLLNAERDALQVQASLVENQRQQLSSMVALYKAVGGGWQRPAQ